MSRVWDGRWAIAESMQDDPSWNDTEAAQLYDLLETQVIPAYYARDENNIPEAWIARVRESMASLTPVYSANRSVREYVETAYVPAAVAYRERALDGGAMGVEISAWRRSLDEGWGALRFGPVTAESRGDRHHFTVQVKLGNLAAAVLVELYADRLGDQSPFRQAMSRLDGPSDSSGMAVYIASVPAIRAVSDYTPRIVPAHPGVNTPLEAPYILWQR